MPTNNRTKGHYDILVMGVKYLKTGKYDRSADMRLVNTLPRTELNKSSALEIDSLQNTTLSNIKL